ncbi:MAG: ATP-dependent Lon protease [Candidatus Dependentiae bacterium]|nr:ATP-dependent Lon protease [Candidatus Dependentiae bacterium]
MKKQENKTVGAAQNREIAVVPTIDVVVFPHMVVPLLVLDSKIIAGIQQAMREDKKVLMLATKMSPNNYDDEGEPISIEDLFAVGTVGEIIRLMELSDGGIKILVQGVQKALVHHVTPTDDALMATIELIAATNEDCNAEKRDYYVKNICTSVAKLPANNTLFSPDFTSIVYQIESPQKVSDFVLSHLNLPVNQAQELLEKESITQVLDAILHHLERLVASTEIEEKIRTSTRDSINKSQREYYLREQLRAIQKELGDDSDSDIEDFENKGTALQFTDEARTEFNRQISRLKKTSSDSLEATVMRNHIEWLLGMPWGTTTKDNNDITVAKKILDEGHFGLHEVKERILDYLSIKYLKNDCASPILCLAGPPGVGKTSLGKSIAQAMGRTFARIAVGGVHDEAEVRGHRRTYVGALPGRFVQAIKKAGSLNPVLLIDEIDKIGSSHKGDPSAALLEALDPEQNKAFYDNYLGVHFDFSKVLFITTANDLSTIPGPLRDRMEVIQLSGYTKEEKLEIAKRHLTPNIVVDSGLGHTDIAFSKDVIEELITGYTREAGVRGLSKLFQKLCAKYARHYIENKKGISFTKRNLVDHLGPRRIIDTLRLGTHKVGITNGLAWTPYGGEVLQMEALLMPGTGKLILTGQLGEVMKESARAAVSYARSHAKEFNIDAKMFSEYDLHLHAPAGGIPKDGPSAGITLLSSIFSVYTGRPVNSDYAMTGELNLQGNVMPIGGVKEKLLAAKQHGFSRVIFPKQNEKDVKGIGALPEGIKILFVEDVQEVLSYVLLPKP